MERGGSMMEISEIIIAVIGVFLLFSIGVFIFSIIRKWGKIYIIVWGLLIFLSTHLLLFYLVVFVEIGQDIHIFGGDLNDAINSGVRQAYKEAYFHKKNGWKMQLNFLKCYFLVAFFSNLKH